MINLLLIEDEEVVRKLMTTILGRFGYTVLTAGSGAEAQALWREKSAEISVLITDNTLPDASGVHLAQTFKAEKPQLKVIVASGMSQEDLPGDFYQLQKPFDMKLLLAFVQGALDEPVPP